MAMYTILRRATAAVLPLAARRAAVPSSSRTIHSALSVKLLLRKDTTPFVPSRSFSNAVAKDHAEQVEIPEKFPFEIEEIEDSTDERTIRLKERYSRGNFRVTTIQLKRQYEDETIQVLIHNIGSKYVSVFKGNGVCLEFDVRAGRDEVVIDSLSIKKPGESEDQLVYKVKGPKFSHLDEKLQKAFHKYLEIRGITPDTFNYLNELAIKKEKKDNSVGLQYLKSIIEK